MQTESSNSPKFKDKSLVYSRFDSEITLTQEGTERASITSQDMKELY